MQPSNLFSRRSLAALLAVLALSFAAVPAGKAADAPPPPLDVPSGIDAQKYDVLLKKYVDEQGLVNYSAWKSDAADVAALDSFLQEYTPKADKPAEGNERAAALANAYNAGVLSWILKNYPTNSVWETKDAFTAKRYTIGGQQVALNDIENGALRPQIGLLTHSVLVCAARSCPPLQRSAYSGADFDTQDAKAYHVWLGRPDLNKFQPSDKTAEISSIFKWYKEDFDKAGGIKKVLAEKAPASDHLFLASGEYEVSYLPYNWGLNDQGEHGRSYNKLDLVIDHLFH